MADAHRHKLVYTHAHIRVQRLLRLQPWSGQLLSNMVTWQLFHMHACTNLTYKPNALTGVVVKPIVQQRLKWMCTWYSMLFLHY